MKFFKELSSIEVKELEKELKQWCGSYIDKIYFDSELAMRLHHPDLGKIILRYLYPYVFLTKKVPEIRNKGFGLLLKKYVEHQKITNIYQLGSERVIVFELFKGKLVFELFFHGNVLILNENDEIIAMSNPKGGRKKESKVYELKARDDVFNMNLDSFKEIVIGKEIVKALARLIGNIYAEEILWRLNIAKNKILENHDEVEEVFKMMQEMISENAKFVLGDGFFAVRELKSLQWNQEFKRFSEMIESIVEKNPFYDEKIEKLKKAIEMQKQEIKTHENEIKKLERVIELIYTNYSEIETLLKGLQKNENVDVNTINKVLNSFKVVSIDKKNKQILIDFQDELFHNES